VIRGIPGDERRVLMVAAPRRDERVEVSRRRAAKAAMHLVVDGPRQRGEEPLLRVRAERIEPLSRVLRPRRGAAGHEELAQEQARHRLAVGRGIGGGVPHRVERIDRRRRGGSARAKGESDRPEGEQAGGGAKESGTHRRAV
jgi:hypothetical protein